ncbi:MAG: hypothetical protein P8X58_01400 [Syntrophobacterales bacterium]|jgi:hypothetical protein
MLATNLESVLPRLKSNVQVILLLALACWMAWGNVRRRRIPNYLTPGTALAGLGFQFGTQGWYGLGQGLLGLGLLGWRRKRS